MLIDYLAKNYHVDVSKVSPSMDLVKEGILDSGGVIEFVMFVEQAFSTQIADELNRRRAVCCCFPFNKFRKFSIKFTLEQSEPDHIFKFSVDE